MNIDAEIRDLKSRVSAIERSLESPHQHVSALHKDLLAFQARTEQWFDRTLGRSGRVAGRFDAIDGALDRIEHHLHGIRTDMPGIVRCALRDALGGKSRRKS
jgi:hypothetical protein